MASRKHWWVIQVRAGDKGPWRIHPHMFHFRTKRQGLDSIDRLNGTAHIVDSSYQYRVRKAGFIDKVSNA